MDMKKIITCAALLAGIAFFNGRLNAQVESDIVGYTTIAMEAGKWYQVGSPFVALDDTASTQKINEVFTIGFSEGDSINILNTAAMEYVAYYWKTSANGWCTKRGTTPVDVKIPAGQALFVNKASAGIGSVSAQ